MTHVRQDFALRRVRGFGVLSCLPQNFLRFLLLGDIHKGYDSSRHAALW
jgi:hypothetical protein